MTLDELLDAEYKKVIHPTYGKCQLIQVQNTGVIEVILAPDSSPDKHVKTADCNLVVVAWDWEHDPTPAKISQRIKSNEKTHSNAHCLIYDYLDIVNRCGRMVVFGVEMVVHEGDYSERDEDYPELDGFSAISYNLESRENYDYQYGTKTIDDLPILDGHVRYISPDELGLECFKFPNQSIYDFLDKLQVEIEGNNG